MDHAAHPPLPSPLPAGRAAAAGRGRRLLIALVTLPVVMLVFFLFFFKAFYGLWCRMSGTQLSPNNPAAALAPTVHTGRFITINFEGSPYDELPVRFYPDQAEIQYEVGTDGRNTYHFKNISDEVVAFRPIHQVSPIAATTAFGMKVCFCFTNQTIGPHETRDFPVVFTFNQDLDPRIRTVTIRYGLFRMRAGDENDALLKRRQEQIMGEGIVTPGAAGNPPLGGAPSAPSAPALPGKVPAP